MSRASRVPLTYHLPALQNLDSLERVETTLAGLVLLGSGASVNDDIPWQTDLKAWIKPHLDNRTPCLGLCYGHQLLVHLFGGDVANLHSDGFKEVGFRQVHLAPNPLWGDDASGDIVVSHREHVVCCPASFRVTGSSPLVPVEAVSHRDLPLWGVQGHPEATDAFLANNGLSLAPSPDAFAFGHSLVDAFLDWCTIHAVRTFTSR